MNYSKLTVKQYTSKLNKLKDMKIDVAKCENAKALYDYLKTFDLADTSIRIYLQAILWSDKNENTAFKKDASEIISQISKTERDERGNNILQNAQKVNYIDWNEVLNVYETLKGLKRKSRKDAFNYLLVSLYVLFPPRRIADYGEMKILELNGENLNKYIHKGLVSEETSDNYYVKGERVFIFNRYKTNKKMIQKNGKKKAAYKQQLFKISDELETVIEDYIKYVNLKGGDSLLLGISGETLTRTLNSIFYKYTRKRVSVNILRHSYITHMMNQEKYNYNEMNDIARKMGHSINSQMQYYKNI